MLVLTRKSNQSIMIGDDIEVSVLAIMGEKVRIGIQAPRDIPVFRKEVYLEIQQERLGEGESAREEGDAALPGLGGPRPPSRCPGAARGRGRRLAEQAPGPAARGGGERPPPGVDASAPRRRSQQHPAPRRLS